jgi:hypothetical protein
MSEDVQVIAKVQVPAGLASVAWVNAYLATGQEKERTPLYRKLSLEVFPGGIQLIGCNGQALFRTWVPQADGDWDSEWPDNDVAPEQSIVISDEDGFGLAFIKTVLAATKDDAHINEKLMLEIAPADEGEEPSLGEALAKQRLILHACGQRLELQVFDVKFPHWRKLQLGIDASERIERLAIGTKVFGLLGKLKGVPTVDLDFHGEEKAVVFMGNGAAMVRGLLMPCRRPEENSAAS